MRSVYAFHSNFFDGSSCSVPWMDTPDVWQFEKQSGDRIISI